MENISYIGLSKQIALTRQMELVSNNIANLNTNGYQGNKAMFNEYIFEPKSEEPVSMVLDYGSYRDETPGPITQTGNPLDMALSGSGYIAIEDQEGIERYTRNGSFQLNAERELVNSSGLRVMSQNGGAIVFPEDSREIKITTKGEITADGRSIGQLKLAEFENDQMLENIGGSLLSADNATPVGDEITTEVFQGAVENSNVNPVLELTDMIELSRLYQATARLMQSDHERQQNAIRTLSQV